MADERDELDETLDSYGRMLVDHLHMPDPSMAGRRLTRARSIRARERKLAELAREMRSWMIDNRDCGYFMSDFEIEWLQRMQKELDQ